MGTLKRLTRHDWTRRIACWFVAQYIRFVRWTGLWRARNDGVPKRLWAEGQPFILAFWHGRLLMMPYCWNPSIKISMLISQHVDGQLIARTVSHFGIATVAGSSSKGGVAALRRILGVLKAGECVGFTPDGPRGPRGRASPGVVYAARLAGVPIVPCSYGVTRRCVLGSWDRFVLALPFARGVFLWGDPIEVARDSDAAAIERARLMVEERLNELGRMADALCGTAPIEPDSAPVGFAADEIVSDLAPAEIAAEVETPRGRAAAGS
jgi:lysophospholipid acyltransferase (LPLAT)-like uncharacterized protein